MGTTQVSTATRDPRKFVRAVRSGKRGDQRIVTYGKLVCASCEHMLPIAQLAERVGVTASQMTNFLNHRTCREDVAAKIRLSVLEVDE